MGWGMGSRFRDVMRDGNQLGDGVRDGELTKKF